MNPTAEWPGVRYEYRQLISSNNNCVRIIRILNVDAFDVIIPGQYIKCPKRHEECRDSLLKRPE